MEIQGLFSESYNLSTGSWDTIITDTLLILQIIDMILGKNVAF